MSSNGTGQGQSSFGAARTTFARGGPVIFGIAVVLVIIIAGLSKAGCVNLHTPPGHEGYLRSQPLVGAGKYVGTQKGPTSTGWVWRQEIINIDMRPRTYSQEMSIRTSKGSELKFRAHARIKLRDGGVKDIVERLGGAGWYASNVQKTFERAIRERVQKLEPFEVKNQSLEIASAVMATMQEEYKGRPVEFLSVDIGDIQYPETIVQSVIKKFVTYEENQRKDIELKIAQAQIQIGIAEAEGTSDAQHIIRMTLDPMFLQYEALGAIEELSSSQNTTFVVAPLTKGGTAPLIMSLDK